MPPQSATLSVVINRSETETVASGVSRLSNAPKVQPRTYDDTPLPIRASVHAPANAKIISRVFDGGRVAFELKIGETVLKDVGLEEVLDYVSPYHLEDYENEEFKKEGELLRIAEEEDRRATEEERLRRKIRAKTKGTVIIRPDSSEEDATSTDFVTGKHGRARPSYKPLFKLPERKRRRRRKRDPVTGELMPLSDESNDDLGAAQPEYSSDEAPATQLPFDNMGLPKRRRRRKRDPVTGELMPLDSDLPPSTNLTNPNDLDDSATPELADLDQPKKRPRRRRHPITRELMPLGWRYEDELRKESQIQSMQRLSLTGESQPKRRRLEESQSPWRKPVSPSRTLLSATQAIGKHQELGAATLSAFQKGGIVTLHDSDSDTEYSVEEKVQVAPTGPKPKLLRRSLGGAPIVEIPAHDTRLSQGSSNVSQLPVRASPSSKLSMTRPSYSIPPQVKEEEEESSSSEDEPPDPGPVKPATSIMHPSARNEESETSISESEDDTVPEDEFVIEAILGHGMSEPRTHPSHMGSKPVMLYKVKWEGWEDPTWEPKESFGDLSVIREYQEQVGMIEDLVDD